MNEGTLKDNEYQELLKSPTNNLWQIELSKIVNGKRTSIIDKQGSIEEYIESILHEYNDVNVSRIFFNNALKEFIQNWQPDTTDSVDNNYNYLDLIGAYTPFVGYVKIMLLITKYSKLYKSNITDKKENRLINKMFYILEKYYPVKPPDEYDNEYTFNVYVNILKKYLTIIPFKSYISKRLIELNIFKPHEQELFVQIENQPDMMYSFVDIIFQEDSFVMKENLRQLYIACLKSKVKLENIFIDVLNQHDAKLVDTMNSVHISLRNDIDIPINLPKDVQPTCILNRWTRNAQPGLDKFKKM